MILMAHMVPGTWRRGPARPTRRLLTAVCVALLASFPPGPAAGQIPVDASYDDDFILETEDGAFRLRIRGNLHLDTRLYQAERLGAVQNIDLRRARIDFMGRIHERFTFRVQPELAGSPYIRNAWADWELARALHLRFGQMKVPFSAAWLTKDNNLNFIERGTAGPVHPFFDRGFNVWGELLGGTVTYDLGVFTGVGVDADVPAGDVDDGKEWTGRLFLQPFRNREGSLLQGLILAGGGTYAPMTVPTARTELRGLRSANYGTALWRWNTEQVLGTDGRVTDRVGAEIDLRQRLGLELHWVHGPLAFSAEALEVRYRDVTLYHDYLLGSDRIVHEELLGRSGAVQSWSTWVSYYLTGESKRLTPGGWRTARPETTLGEGGPGALELLLRYSVTEADRRLFDAVAVAGFGGGLGEVWPGTTPGRGNVVTASVLRGAREVNELTVGLNWSLNPMVKLQLNDVFLWAPPGDLDGDGANDNLLLSGAFTAQSDPERKGRGTEWENAVMLRLVFKF